MHYLNFIFVKKKMVAKKKYQGVQKNYTFFFFQIFGNNFI